MARAKRNHHQKPIDICVKSPNGAHYWVNKWESRLWKCIYCGYTTDKFPMTWEELTRGLKFRDTKQLEEICVYS